MDSHNSFIIKEGIPYILTALIIALINLFFNFIYLTILFLFITFFLAYFFRNPKRNIPDKDGVILSPADGRVVEIEDVEEENYIRDRAIKVGIFMTIFNVHINRIPFKGKVIDIFYKSGKFLMAFKRKASTENEQNALIIETEDKKMILLIQIAGIIARRIICWVKKGETVSIGDRFGLICFGSRIDIYLPYDVKLNVKINQLTRAGETILGYIK